MARRSRRTFTPEFKAKVVLDVLIGSASQAGVCRKHQISPSLFALWKATLLVGQQALELAALKKASTWLAGATTSGGES
jgi:transposase-like protein